MSTSRVSSPWRTSSPSTGGTHGGGSPPPPVLLSFVAGTVAVLPVIFVRALLPLGSSGSGADSLLAVAGVEEAAKLAVGLLLAWRWGRPEVIEPIDFVIYFGVLGAGFGVIEDLEYIFAATRLPWLEGDFARFRETLGFVVLARAFPGHVLFSALGGLLVGWARFARSRLVCGAWLVGALAVGTVLHAGFNAVAEQWGQVALLVYVVALVGALLGVRRQAQGRSRFRAVTEAATGGEGGRAPTIAADLLADGFHWPGRRRSRLFQAFPLILSLTVLYPLLLTVVHFAAWALTRAVSR